MRFRSLLWWILWIGFIILLIILLPSWISWIRESIKEDDERAKKQREENQKKKKAEFDALPKNEKDRIKKMHKEWKKRLIWLFSFYILLLSLPVIISLFWWKDCSDYDEDFKSYILETYAHFWFEAIDYWIQSSQDTCIWYTHWLTTNAFTWSEHLYVIRDIIWWNNVYACREFKEDCSNSDYLSTLHKYNIK